MCWDDHNPPHFHIRYGEHKAAIAIDTLTLLDGSLPPRALGLVVERASQHTNELLRNWERAWSNQPLPKIAPLE